MRQINCIFNFFGNGFRVFMLAASGRYQSESEAISEMRKQMFDDKVSDRMRMRQDMLMLGKDWRSAINKTAVKHG